LVEHSTENAGVVGSIPTVATTKKTLSNLLSVFFIFSAIVEATKVVKRGFDCSIACAVALCLGKNYLRVQPAVMG
jgi:hypothetical protein